MTSGDADPQPGRVTRISTEMIWRRVEVIVDGVGRRGGLMERRWLRELRVSLQALATLIMMNGSEFVFSPNFCRLRPGLGGG